MSAAFIQWWFASWLLLLWAFGAKHRVGNYYMSLKFFVYLSLLLRIYIYTYSFLCGTSVVDCLIVISPFKCWYKTLRKHLYMFAFSLFLTDSWYIIFYLFIVFASFLCSMYLLLCGYITFKCLNKALGYISSCIHFITLNTTQLHSLATSIL